MSQPNTNNTSRRFTMPNPALTTAVLLLTVGLVIYVWMDLATHSMFYPLSATALFAAFFAVPALLLLWRASLRAKLALLAAFLLLILAVRGVEWNTRKPFLDSLARVRPGMTALQVDAVMRGFVRSPRAGISDYDTVGYRHTDQGWGNADVGLVTFADRHVVKVEYLPD